MSKKYLIISTALLILILAGGNYYYSKIKSQKSTSSIVNPAVESVQSVNPYDKTNPYSDIKVNPFE